MSYASGAFAQNESSLSTVQSTNTPAIDPAIEKIVETKNKLIATPDLALSITIEGQALPMAQVMRNEEGHVFVRAEPILDFLNDSYNFDGEAGVLVVRRSQDGVRMELYTDTGVIKANGKTIGKLRIFGQVTPEAITLTPNAIAVLSGARPKHDEVAGILHFELDPRLKVATGFQIYVNDSLLINPEPAAKSVGPVLLLPLLPIADELGSFVTMSPDRSTVSIRRAQDSAEFDLNLSTGLIRDKGRPIGVSKDATYIDAVNLLLPVSAIEVLTGTHITVDAGSDRVSIELDERLSGSVAPDSKISDLASTETFTLESLKFTVGPDVRNEVTVNFRARGLNGKIRYEIPDMPTSSGELKPSWGALQYRTLNGLSGTVGDYSADLRELDGVGIRRIRGASASKAGKKGRWALAAGTPVNGSVKVSDEQSRFTFGGMAAGLRWADIDGWEAGLSMRYDEQSEDQRLVLSFLSGKLGSQEGSRVKWNARGDMGYFSGPDRDKSLDIRAGAAARMKITDNWDVDVTASYDGAEFLKSVLSREALEKRLAEIERGEEDVEDGRTIPDIRSPGQDQATLSSTLQYSARRIIGPLKNPGVALRVQRSTSGVSVGAGTAVTLDNWGLTGSTTLAKTNTYLTAAYTQYSREDTSETKLTEDGYSLSVQGYQTTKLGTIRAQYSQSEQGGTSLSQRADMAYSIKARSFNMPKSAKLSVAPTINAVWTPEQSFVRGGLVANADSGDIFGRKNRVTAAFGVLQNFGGKGSGEPDTYFTLSAGRRLQINNNLTMGLSYRNDLKGEQRIGLRLDGRYNFNEGRKFKNTETGRGVLKGRAFLDKNRDGVRQDGEPGLPGITLRVAGGSKRLALRTDSGGYYTIQNIKTGIKTMTLDGRSLPLGFALSDETLLRATIRDGHITTVDLPIVQRGQITGFAYIDKNANGEYERGEIRLEGARLRLTDKSGLTLPQDILTTSFGQYAFDDLAAGNYELTIVKTNNPNSVPGTKMAVALDPARQLMSKTAIGALTKITKREFVEDEGTTTIIADNHIQDNYEGGDYKEGDVIGSP